jgi:hypothetical protein
MPKVLFFSDPSNGRPGLGATIQLDSGEPCLMSIANGWVRVKKSRYGLFGPTLYNERNAYRTALTARTLSLIFADSLLPPGFTDPVLSAFANAILHCSTCKEVAVVLNEAMVRAEDSTIVCDFADLMAKGTIRPDAFYDVSVLPHPKETIIAAIERQILWEPKQERIEWLKTGALLLWNFQRGVGSSPLPLLGENVGPMPRGGMTADEIDAMAERIATSPNRQRANQFRAIADSEAKQIEERIAAAIRLRGRAAVLNK